MKKGKKYGQGNERLLPESTMKKNIKRKQNNILGIQTRS